MQPLSSQGGYVPNPHAQDGVHFVSLATKYWFEYVRIPSSEEGKADPPEDVEGPDEARRAEAPAAHPHVRVIGGIRPMILDRTNEVLHRASTSAIVFQLVEQGDVKVELVQAHEHLYFSSSETTFNSRSS